MTSLALALLLTQEPTVDSVVDAMEKRAGELQDLSLESRTEAQPMMPVGLRVGVTYVRGGGVRVRSTVDLQEGGPAAAAMVSQIPIRADYIYGPEALHIRQEWGRMPAAGVLVHQTYRVRYDDPSLERQDHQFLPQGYPARMMIDEPLVYYAVAPRLFFSLDPGLALDGTREEGGRKVHVLVSRPRGAAAPKPRGGEGLTFHMRRKEFWVDAEDFSIRRIRLEVSFEFQFGGQSQEQRMEVVITPQGSLPGAGPLTLPERVLWEAGSIGQAAANVRSQGTRVVHRIEIIRVNQGLDAAEVMTEEEKADLYADAVLGSAETYEGRIRRNPDDAEAHFSLAHVHGGVTGLMSRMMAGGGAPGGLGAKVLDPLERAAELRPGAAGPWLNLLSLYESEGLGAKEKALITRVERGELPGALLRLRAATRLNAMGEYERAGAMLEAFEPANADQRREVSLQGMVVAAGRGNAEVLVRTFVEEASRRKGATGRLSFVRDLRHRAGESVREKMSGLLERAAAAHPRETAFALFRAETLRESGRPAGAGIAVLEAAPGDRDMVEYLLDGFLDPENEGADPFKEEKDPKPFARLAELLAGQRGGDPRLRYVEGRSLLAAGRPEEAKTRLEAALEACSGQVRGKPHHEAAVTTVLGLSSLEGGAWLERGVGVLLEIGEDGRAIPPRMLYDDARNPVVRLAMQHVSSGKWKELYRLVVDGKSFIEGTWQLRQRLEESPQKKACLDTVRREARAKGTKEAYLELARFFEALNWDEEVPAALEEAYEKAPEDRDLLEDLAASHSIVGSHARAAECYAKLAAGAEGKELRGVRLQLADARISAGQIPGALEALEAVRPEDLDEGTDAEWMADLYKRAKAWDRALAACRRAYALGRRPHFLMGWILEQKGRLYEALRYYNRDIEEPSTESAAVPGVVEPQVQQDPDTPQPERDPLNGEEARERLLKRQGRDWLIREFLAGEFEPMTAGEERAAKATLRRLGSDSIVERDEALDDLAKLGPKAAPLLKPFLNSPDGEVKTRVRQLLGEWAEPR